MMKPLKIQQAMNTLTKSSNDNAMQAVEIDRTASLLTREGIASMCMLMAKYNGETALPQTDAEMLRGQIEHFKVTKEEFEDAFWKASADHFTGQRMHFRHLWKFINEAREAKECGTQKFPFGEVMRWLEKRNLPLDYLPYFVRKPEGKENWFYLKAEFKNL